jgi:transcription initiation factor TFIIB
MNSRCEVREEKNNLIHIELTFNSDVELPLGNGESLELERYSDKLVARLLKTPNIDKQLEKGVIIDGEHFPLSYPEPPSIKYQRLEPVKPIEKSLIKEVTKKLVPSVSQPLEGEQVPKIKEPSPVEPVKVHCCPECGSTRLITDYEMGEKVCTDCGFVVAETIADRGPEWRVYDGEQRAKRTRVGAPLTYTIHDKGLSTAIDWRDKDIYGKGFSPVQKAQMYRLRKWQRRIRVSDATERNLAHALSEINKITDNLSLPRNILETASIIYRKAVKERLIRGRSTQGVSAAAIYLACRKCGLARTLEEIAQASSVNKKEVGRSYRHLVKELDYSVPPLKPSQYITKFSNQLTMQGKVEEIAHKILATAKEVKLTAGRGPTGMAAAASYIASVLTGERKTQREIAEIARVTEVTIRNRYRELVERLTFQITV